jgi:hypothetical protein
LVTIQSKIPYLPTCVNNVKNLNVFIKICPHKISPYEGGGAMVKDLILRCEGDDSNHHTCNLGHYLGSLVRLSNMVARLNGLVVSVHK